MTSCALEDLETAQKNLNSTGKKHEKSARHFEIKTLFLTVTYIIFQSIIFLAVSIHRNLSCRFSWIPFCLSLLVAAVFAITFKSFITNWERTLFHYDENLLQQDIIHYQIAMFPLRESKPHDHHQPEEEEELQCDKVTLYVRYAFISLVSVALVSYTIIILISCRCILCHA